MILGSGLLARAFDSFKEDDRVVVFASGVSNSSTATEVDHARERNLLLEQSEVEARLVYFSTCSLFDPALKDSSYIRHKMQMEVLIQTRFKNHTILRLPNLVGSSPNPHTLCNHIRDRIQSSEQINVQIKACRYLMDVDTVSAVCTPLLTDEHFRGRTLNVCFDQPVPIPELVAAMERLLGKKARTLNVDSGSCYEVDNRDFKQYWLSQQRIPWPGADDWAQMLAKYYGGPKAATVQR